MSGVYEALQRVRQGGQQRPAPAARLGGGEEPTASAGRTPGTVAIELTPLLSAARPLLDGGKGAVLHFVAATTGEGTTTIAREFALLAGTTGRRRTLLIDAARRDPQTARSFDCDMTRGLIEDGWIGTSSADLQRLVPGTSLSVACLIGARSNYSADPVTLRALYQELRQQFDLIVVDCPAIEDGEYVTLLPEEADGIFLVVRAERTRPAVISHAKGLVEQVGGHFLGAVLNARRNYIPNFMYRML